MVLPVNRCQSVVSTANANPVNGPMPRSQPSLFTSGVNSESAAISLISLSSRSLRATVWITAS